MNAARKLEPLLAPPSDPVLAAILRAPVSDEPETEEERAAFELGMADVRAGRVRAIGQDEMTVIIERMRREQGE